MATLAQADRARAALSALADLSDREARTLLRSILRSGRSAEWVRDALLDVWPALSERHGLAAAVLGADFYNELRAAAGVRGAFRAAPTGPFDPERAAIQVRWGVDPMFRSTPDPGLAESLLAGGFQRLILDYYRATITDALAVDPSEPVGYRRQARPDACAFCALLATRDVALYGTRESAQFVTGVSLGGKDYKAGRTVQDAPEMFRAARKGTKRTLGERYHDDCRCLPVAIWNPDDYEEPAHVQRWRETYLRTGTSNNLKASLAAMREELDIA